MVDLNLAVAVVAVVAPMVLVVEIVLYFRMPIAWMSVLPFRHKLEEALKPGNMEAATRGTTSGGYWRYVPAHRMLVFRRTMGFGSRTYVLGSIYFAPAGTEVRWAPPGLLFCLVLCVDALVQVAQADMVIDGLFQVLFVFVFFGVYWVFCRQQIRTGLVPEVEMGWLDEQRGL
jgi:hypothetical protein